MSDSRSGVSRDPIVSIVATSRNDDHGGSLLRRMQIFVSGFIAQCKRHNLAAELILVEWNPPPERLRFAQALRWPDDPKPCDVRIIEVSPERHARIRHAAELPLFQMIAKNVGIRRARGQFILATNIDVLFSDELIRFMASGKLQPGKMYRIDRYDVSPDVPVEASVEEQLRYCEQHMLRVNSIDGTFNVSPDGRRLMGPDDIAAAESGLELGDGWYPLERGWMNEPYRWVRSGARFSATPPDDAPRAMYFELEPGPGVGNRPFELLLCNADGRTIARCDVAGRQRVMFAASPTPGGVMPYSLAAEGGGQPTPREPRALDFRVLRFGWSAALSSSDRDALSGGALPVDLRMDITAGDVRLGEGWWFPECAQGELFRWAANNLEVFVPASAGGAGTLTLDVAPGPSTRRNPLGLDVLDDSDRTVARAVLTGRCTCALSLALSRGTPQRLRLQLSGGDQIVAGDPRILNLQVFSIRWERAAPPATERSAGTLHVQLKGEPCDIFPVDAGSTCGNGWFGFEHWEGETFRWADNDAEILLRTTDVVPRRLRIDLEVGPSAPDGTLTLEIQDEQGRSVARQRAAGRRLFEFNLPTRPSTLQVFRLHVEGGGAAAPGDTRILNFRVFRAVWVHQELVSGDAGALRHNATPKNKARVESATTNLRGVDPSVNRSSGVGGATTGIHFGDGWMDVESLNGTKYRYMRAPADLLVRAPAGQCVLELDAEPGPACRGGGAALELRDLHGRLLARAAVRQREFIQLKLPLAACEWNAIRLVAAGDDALALDGRSAPALRVFDVGCVGAGEADTAMPPLPVPPIVRSPGKAEIDCPVRLHTNACGDFTLMARQHWFDLRGYPELEIFSFHLDSVLCFAAHHGGAVEEILPDPMRIYHIEHGLGSGWTPEGQTKLWDRIASKGIPFLEDDDMWRWATQMRWLQAPMIFNRDDWGFAGESLRETRIGPTRS